MPSMRLGSLAVVICLGLVTGCLDYDKMGGQDRQDDCADLDCVLSCAADADCDVQHLCVQTHDGCCSHCERDPCESDQDCEFCQICDLGSGICQGIPCVVDCVDDQDCASGELCEVDVWGCCGRCVPSDPCAHCSPGCECNADDLCICPGDEVTLSPTCVHAP